VKLIVGLGNPGKRYSRTPHNIGFDVVDRLGERLSTSLRRSIRFKARIGKARLEDETLVLLEPQAYVNRSGNVVAAVLRYRRMSPSDMVVVLDDADMEAGKLRIRAKGGSGGHKGLASIIDCVGTDAFARVRIGIGRGEGGRDIVEHVLTPFTSAERARVEPAIEKAEQAVLCIIESGLDRAMNMYNARK